MPLQTSLVLSAALLGAPRRLHLLVRWWSVSSLRASRPSPARSRCAIWKRTTRGGSMRGWLDLRLHGNVTRSEYRDAAMHIRTARLLVAAIVLAATVRAVILNAQRQASTEPYYAAGQRMLLDAHNCYNHQEIDRALSTDAARHRAGSRMVSGPLGRFARRIGLSRRPRTSRPTSSRK